MFEEYVNFANIKDHEALKDRVHQMYKIEIAKSELISWGYHSFTIYMETATGRKIIARIANKTPERDVLLQRAILVEQLLAEVIPTPRYIENIEGSCITDFEKQTIRLHEHIEGTAPFDMNKEIFVQMIDVLNKIHGFSNKAKGLDKLYLPTMPAENYVLLHGDLTPSNIIVASNKISGVLDFENTILGPAEYDLAYMTLFSWYRFKRIDFTNLTDLIKHHYHDYNSIDIDKLNDFAKKILERHLNNIIKHKDDYINKEHWKNEKEYFQNLSTRLHLELH